MKNNHSDKRDKAFLDLSIESFVVPVFRIPAMLFSSEGINTYDNKGKLVMDIFGLQMLLAALFMVGNFEMFSRGKNFIALVWVAWIIIGVLALGIAYQGIQWRKRLAMKVSSGSAISASKIPFNEVLKIMDDTAHWYNDENEANRELVTCLKAMKIDAEYQYKLPDGRIADARVRNILVEGKLSPTSMSEIDTLIGQLNGYTNLGYAVNVVIYGMLKKVFKNRIETEIDVRYHGKVFLSYLDKPQRIRVEM